MEELIAEIQAVLTPDLLHPKYRHHQSPSAHPTTGHCYAATEALYHLLGGKSAGLSPTYGKHPTTNETHWWLETDDQDIIDPTAEQFDIDDLIEIYADGTHVGFQTREPSKRALAIIGRVQRNRMEGNCDE